MNTALSQKVFHGPAESLRRPGPSDGQDLVENRVAREFPNEDACLELIKEMRWPKGIAPCAKCGVARKHHRVSGRKAYACDRCGAHAYPLRGTVFARSSISLLKWFHAIGLLTAEPRVTAKRIQRETGVTYKTAWRMLHRLRATEVSRALTPLQFLELVVASAVSQDTRGERLALSGAPNFRERHES